MRSGPVVVANQIRLFKFEWRVDMYACYVMFRTKKRINCSLPYPSSRIQYCPVLVAWEVAISANVLLPEAWLAQNKSSRFIKLSMITFDRPGHKKQVIVSFLFFLCIFDGNGNEPQIACGHQYRPNSWSYPLSRCNVMPINPIDSWTYDALTASSTR